MMILCAALKRGDHLALPWYPVDFFQPSSLVYFRLLSTQTTLIWFHDLGVWKRTFRNLSERL